MRLRLALEEMGLCARLTSTTASMLKEDPQARPNIYQTLKAACAMQGREVPIKDV